jgi:hypothetical protein
MKYLLIHVVDPTDEHSTEGLPIQGDGCGRPEEGG